MDIVTDRAIVVDGCVGVDDHTLADRRGRVDDCACDQLHTAGAEDRCARDDRRGADRLRERIPTLREDRTVAASGGIVADCNAESICTTTLSSITEVGFVPDRGNSESGDTCTIRLTAPTISTSPMSNNASTQTLACPPAPISKTWRGFVVGTRGSYPAPGTPSATVRASARSRTSRNRQDFFRTSARTRIPPFAQGQKGVR